MLSHKVEMEGDGRATLKGVEDGGELGRSDDSSASADSWVPRRGHGSRSADMVHDQPSALNDSFR